MTLPWAPIIFVEVVGSTLTLLVAVRCLLYARRWAQQVADDIFRQYIFLLTLSIVIFAVSRSCGHLVRHLLLFSGQPAAWSELSPVSGAINTITFVVVFAFGIYFHRFRRIHLEIESYKNDLEEKIAIRTEELAEAKLTLENVLNNSNPICITNLDYELVKVNRAYSTIWHAETPLRLPIKCYQSRPGPLCHTDECPLRQILAGKEEVVLEVAKEVQGKHRDFILTARPLRNDAGELLGMVESFQDISERKITEKRMQELAFYDPLTQLPNRRLFQERLLHELTVAKRHQAQLGLMFLDLDRFKQVNDTLGHSAGDELLVEVAGLLKETVRESDTVARMGGDEFTVIVTEVGSREDLAVLAEKLLAVLRQPVAIGVKDVRVGASIGIALFPEDGTNIEQLMKNADIAMYHSKATGRDRFHFYTPQMEMQSRTL